MENAAPTLMPATRARIACLAFMAAAALGGAFLYLVIEKGGPLAQLRYYTLQSNLLIGSIWLAEIFIVARSEKTSTAFSRLRAAAVMAIMVTGIIFSLFLAGKFRFAGWHSVANFLCHYLSPIAAPLYWLAFAEKGRLRFRQAPLWLAFPLLYVAYSLVQGAFTGFYPYWFLDPVSAPPKGIGSLAGVAAFVGIVSAAFLALGALMVLADTLIARKRRA